MSKLAAALQSFDDATVQRLSLQLAGAQLFNPGDYALQITSINSAAGVTLGIRYRGIDLDGQVVRSADVHTPNTNRTALTSIVRLPTGWIYGIGVFVTAGNPLTGNCYVSVDLVLNDGGASTVLQPLAEGYVSTQVRLLWPGGFSTAPQDGAGALRSIAGATPGAGAEISETVPAGARWELLAFRFQLLTGAAVANRQKILVLDDGTTEFHRVETQVNQTASTTFFYAHAQGYSAGSAGAGATVMNHLPANIRLGPGHRIRTSTGGIQAADQYSAVQYLVREWLEF